MTTITRARTFAGIDPHDIEPPIPVADSWDPRCDPFFRGAWLTYLVTHIGDWVHPTDVWKCEDAWQRTVLQHVAWETVVSARRRGYVIDGDLSLGYCYLRSQLVRYQYAFEREEVPDVAQMTIEDEDVEEVG